MNLKRWIVLCLVLVTITGCTRIGNDMYSPGNINSDDAEQYVWICKERGIYLIKGSYFPFVGKMVTNNGYDYVVAVIDKTSFTINTIQSGTYSYDCGSDYLSYDDSKITCVLSSKRPEYKETFFICKNKKDNNNLFDKKWEFVRYNKNDVTPSDFIFEIENWDSVESEIMISGIDCDDFPLSKLEEKRSEAHK